jgi:hypothetical protein
MTCTGEGETSVYIATPGQGRPVSPREVPIDSLSSVEQAPSSYPRKMTIVDHFSGQIRPGRRRQELVQRNVDIFATFSP